MSYMYSSSPNSSSKLKPPQLSMHVGGSTSRGRRKYREDFIVKQNDGGNQMFLAVFDGHGGQEAAKYAKENLWKNIKSSKRFESDNMCGAITEGFEKTHEDMWKASETWKKKKNGSRNASGTTVACAIIQQEYMYIANVGDSAIFLAKANPKYGNPNEPKVIFQLMTKFHKPCDKDEKARIVKLGGSVMSLKGVLRVGWEQNCDSSQVKSSGSEAYETPKLNMTRSLGDLWSATEDKDYLISPIPHIMFHRFNLDEDKYLIFGSDGLWDVVKPKMCVEVVQRLCKGDVKDSDEARDVARGLVMHALQEWNSHKLRADNVAVIIVFLTRHIPESTESEEVHKDQLSRDPVQSPCDEHCSN